MSLDTTLRKIASKQITRFGRSVTVAHPAAQSGTYSAATGAITGGTLLSNTVYGVVSHVEHDSRTGTVLRGDLLVIVAAQDMTFAPKADDEITVDSVKYKVLDVVVAEAPVQSVIYEIHARK